MSDLDSEDDEDNPMYPPVCNLLTDLAGYYAGRACWVYCKFNTQTQSP